LIDKRCERNFLAFEIKHVSGFDENIKILREHVFEKEKEKSCVARHLSWQIYE
jgi:hypothetical protein